MRKERQVDLCWSLPHYLAHAYPIWEKLPRELRGKLCQPHEPPDPGNWGMIASWQDLEPLRETHQTIYVEHGAGQCYAGDEKSALQPGYSGSGGYRHGGVIGFISPSQTVADRWTTAPAVAVGCPKLDRWRHWQPPAKTVCFVFHWDCTISPEARTAFNYYGPHLSDSVSNLISQGWTVYGHAHPKWEGRIDDALRHAGMAVLADETQVFENCSAMILDNSSLGFEFMALCRPIVWLNAPWYRGDIDHGLRFWRWSHMAPQIDSPEQLRELDLAKAIRDTYYIEEQRDHIHEVYAFTDGKASQRAADWVCNLLS